MEKQPVRKIVVVDDDSVARDSIETYLEVLAIQEQVRFDIILLESLRELELTLPSIAPSVLLAIVDGLDGAWKKAVQLLSQNRIPSILLSAKQEYVREANALSSGNSWMLAGVYKGPKSSGELRKLIKGRL